MTESPPTARLGLILPIVGTGQLWSTQKYIVDNFTKVEAEAVNVDSRLDAVELEGRGTSAQRDAHFGTPSTAAERVTLANKGARWLNTDKGYEQQYFAQFDDAGVGANTPVRKVHGWRAAGYDRVPITAFTASGGTPANVKKYGNTVELSGTSTSIILDGVFTTDFDFYEIEISIPTLASAAQLALTLRAAGAAVGGAVHHSERIAATAASVTSAESAAAASFIIGSPDTVAAGFIGKVKLTDPVLAAYHTHGLFEGGNPGTNWMSGSLSLRSGAAVDGFQISNGGNLNAHSLVRVWGLANGV